jgi:hypothetical protein
MRGRRGGGCCAEGGAAGRVAGLEGKGGGGGEMEVGEAGCCVGRCLTCCWGGCPFLPGGSEGGGTAPTLGDEGASSFY